MSHASAMIIHSIKTDNHLAISNSHPVRSQSGVLIYSRFTTNIAVATMSIRIIWSTYTWTKDRTRKYHPIPHSSRHLAYRASSRLSLSLRSQICETIRAPQRRTSTVTTVCDSHLSDPRNDMTAMSIKPKPQNTSTMELSRILREKRKRRIYEMRRVRRIEVMHKNNRYFHYMKFE